MACLTICRLTRGLSGISRIVPKANLCSPISSQGLLAKPQCVSLFSTCSRAPTKISGGILSQFSRKILSEITAPILVKSRPSSTGGDHVRLWQGERIVAAAFIGLFPACLILQNAIVDALFAALVVMHAHWGLEAVVVDYARPSVVGPILPKIAFLALYLFSAGTLVGLLALVYNGPGIGKTVNNLWSIGGTKKQ